MKPSVVNPLTTALHMDIPTPPGLPLLAIRSQNRGHRPCDTCKTSHQPARRTAAAYMHAIVCLVLAYTCMTMSNLANAANKLKSVDYEVFGRVQGVCFRMYTEDEARKLGVVGWVKNTRQGTVQGQVQGPEEKVNTMKSWLSKVGSPSSRIDRTNFSNEKEITKLQYNGFSTKY
ncbi:acylphosphatase-2 isoform X1 [Pelobates cultripes]|uniref:Acylphosphatase n=1 Tax=Pelobates cultripes TaxID=61616 RepID=A0AAD1VU98_PELCU|nr:acylphosphatase-2 isoform X1 [Pelobates cultripes]